MSRVRVLAAALLACALVPAVPVHAQQTAAAAIETAPPLDPALVEKARPIAAAILPEGTMAKIMGPMMQKMMGPMMDSVGKMPIRDLLKAGGVDPTGAEAMKPATIDQIMAIVDPAYHQRIAVMTTSMFPAIGNFMTQFEPDMREGMAEAFAGRYSAAELDNILAFLRTPTGSKFGSGFMELAADPHYISRVQAMMPKLIAAMPTIMKEPADALAKLPKPRAYKDLSQAERNRLAELLGIDPKKMKP
ncbi:DUF2059 domain-containing protein [Sphingobium nicotianae]|uniref:DUF2059 domain-containing protein n=1 Tax=Sphingobium nicotianae TaxID=2782607 RepID=A0A9X1DCW8_9SPHN|nr:DUF2059 domain-containing protein [Sphingobium nicotianae]MBT2187594.1 DUF2059 domain-containing protein [Sphingobium nicotianae]